MPNSLQTHAEAALAACRERLTPVGVRPKAVFRIRGAEDTCLMPRTAEALRALGARLPVTETAQDIFELRAGDDFTARSAALTAIGEALEPLGLTQRRRHELLDVKGRNGEVLAAVERAFFRTLGLPTTVVRAVAFTPQGQLLLQRRSLSKQIEPGAWDNLAAGMVSSGETPGEAMVRELAEEAGLRLPVGTFETVTPRVFSSAVPVTFGWMTERTLAYRLDLPADFVPDNTDGEAESFITVSPEEALTLIDRGPFMPEAAAAICLELLGR